MRPDQATTTADDRSTATGPDQYSAATSDRETETTTVTVRCTGHVRTEIGSYELEFTFEGDRLRDFLEAFFEEYDLEDMLIAETEADATHSGWAPVPDDLPGTWRKNPEGEQTRPYARVCVNGRFNEHLGGFETELTDGDRVALIYPFMFCC
ncbi:pterin cluster protein [Natrinema amylolyticum]|uniref:pterin cluster protein n=1 Tax=Natrinema amylolyticum TaxID=2878679 RepID=UPI001CFBE883|nr:pterin cluster protein [Natrinema amylolyticum]